MKHKYIYTCYKQCPVVGEEKIREGDFDQQMRSWSQDNADR